jgi:hypothetical protein
MWPMPDIDDDIAGLKRIIDRLTLIDKEFGVCVLRRVIARLESLRPTGDPPRDPHMPGSGLYGGLLPTPAPTGGDAERARDEAQRLVADWLRHGYSIAAPIIRVDIQLALEKVMTDALTAARAPLEAEIERLRNPCDKIFSHKWLDPECVETGCQSLSIAALVKERDSARTSAWEAAREACAQKAEEFKEPRILAMWDRPGGPPGNGWIPLTGKHVAEAIRALSPPGSTGREE